LNERGSLARGGVSQNMRPPLRPCENRAVRSRDAQLPGPLCSTLHVGRLMGSSSTARQYNINVTEALLAVANACQLGGPPSPISAQPTSGLSHLRTPEPRGILKFFSTGVERHAHTWQTSSGLSQNAHSSGGNVRQAGAGCDSTQCGCRHIVYHGQMRCSASPPKEELAAEKPPI